MSIFLFSLAGIPPLGGWLAKFVVFQSLLEPDLTAGGVALAVVVGVNSVIALYYYANVAREMWMRPVPDGDRTPIRIPPRSAPPSPSPPSSPSPSASATSPRGSATSPLRLKSPRDLCPSDNRVCGWGGHRSWGSGRMGRCGF